MEAAAPTSRRLYSPGQVALAAFIGSPMAACWFFARNYRRLGDPRCATRCLAWGGAGTVLLFVVSFYLPDNTPSMALPIGYTVGLRMFARQVHGDAVAEHVRLGGRLGSWWAVIGISILFLAAILAVLVGVVRLLPQEA